MRVILASVRLYVGTLIVLQERLERFVMRSVHELRRAEHAMCCSNKDSQGEAGDGGWIPADEHPCTDMTCACSM